MADADDRRQNRRRAGRGRRSVRAAVLATGLIGLFTPTPSPVEAHGARPVEVDLAELDLEELMEVEVVYAASRYEQTLLEAPAAVSIITAEEIQDHGYRNLAEILASRRGVYATSDRNYLFTGIRGFLRPGDYNSRLLLLIDGHRVNDNLYDAAPVGEDFPLDLELIERVELVRGPASSVYGTSALFGVVNIITKNGAAIDGVRVSAEAGSFDRQRARVDYGRRLDSGWDVVASASWLDSGGQTLYYAEFDDPATGDGIAERADGEQGRRFFAQVTRGKFKAQLASARREKAIPTASWETVFGDPRTRTIDASEFLTLEYSRPVARDGLGFLARASYNRYDYLGDYVFDYGDDSAPYVVVNLDRASGVWWGSQFELFKRFRSGHGVVAGFEYNDNVRQNQSNYDEEVYLDSRGSSHRWAAFLQGELELRDSLRLTLGVRYDHGEPVEAASPRLALVWSPHGRGALKLLYGEAFRAPSAYELLYGDGEVQKPSGRLDEEKIKALEAAWEQSLGRRWRGVLSAYRYELAQLIGLTTDPADEMLVFVNEGGLTVRGLEAEIEGCWRGLGARASYAYQQAEAGGDARRPSNSPRHVGQMQLRHGLLDRRLLAAASVRYLSDRLTLADGVAGAHLVVDASLLTRLQNDRLRLSLGLYNLFDERYADPGSEEHLQELIEQDGRSWRLQLSYRH